MTMTNNKIEFGEVRFSFANAEQHSERSAEIARSTFAQVQQMMLGNLQWLSTEKHLSHVSAGPVHVSFATMDDETIARISAMEIYRALLQAL